MTFRAKWNRTHRKPGRAQAFGLTLLEVVVGLVLMATLFITSWSAISQHRHHRAYAIKKQQACVVADKLLAQWYDLDGHVPHRSVGQVGQRREWTWQTQVIGTTMLCGLQLSIIRLEILGNVGSGQQTRVLCSVELVQRETGSGER